MRFVRTLAICALLSASACSGGGSTVQTSPPFVPGSSTDSNFGTRVTSSLATIATTISETPTSADSFVNSVGIDTHFLYFDTPYVKQYTRVLSLLDGLGVRHIRDGLNDHDWAPYTTHLEQIARMGIHVTADTVIADTPASIRAGLTRMPNVVESIEAPNEYDLNSPSDWIAPLRTFQKMLYSTIKATPGYESLPVYGPSITRYDHSLALGDLSSELDFGTMHDYFGGHNPGNAGGTQFPVGKYNSLQFWIGTAHLISGSKPLVTTETGYEDSPNIANSVSPSIKARYTMRELLLQWNAHVARTFFYELVDEGGQSLGFIDGSLRPKPVYTAVQNLLHKLSDKGPAFPLNPLTYSIAADPSVAHTLLQKRDRSYRVMCWVETAAVDPKVPIQAVVIKTATKFKTVQQFIWNDDGSIKNVGLAQKADGTITFAVTDRVSEVKLQQ